ncbi:MAG: SpoIIE family protein phosphatase [Deltaproteobacteria bacterium]|nr:SpoIIE family protein phosphatase [Deltaproteobacteria bacterium]
MLDMKFLRSPKIASQLIIWFLTIALVPLSFVSYVIYQKSEHSLFEGVTEDLLSVAQRQSKQILTYIRERERNVTTLSRMPGIVIAMKEFDHAFKKKGIDSPEYGAVDRKLRPFLTYYQESFRYDDLFLISSEGNAVFSVKRGEDFGSNYITGIYRTTELAKTFARASTLLATAVSDFEYYPPTNEPAAFIASPILDKGLIIGVVALQMNNEEIYSIVNDYTGLGETGETIIASKLEHRAIFKTPSRHDPYAAFRKKIPLGSGLDSGIEKSVQGRKGAGIITDYRGEETLAVWKYIPNMRWGMVSKIDTEEAFRPIAHLRKLYVTMGLITLILVVASAIFVARSISDPILKLTGITKTVAEGDLEQKIEIAAKNEIGALAASFNEMIRKLKESIEELKITTAAKERIESELEIAHDIQMGILPKVFPPFPDRHEFDIYATLEPAKEVGGDLYDFFFLDDDHLCFAVGDVSGKGVPAALFMAMTKILIKTKATRNLTPDIVLTRVNQDLTLDNPALMFVTLFLGILNLRTGELEYSNGGHNPPYLIRRDGHLEPLATTHGMALGVMEDVSYQSKKILVQKGEKVFLYTDGVTEAMNERYELFSGERLEKELSAMGEKSLEGIINGLMSKIRIHAESEPQSDDITMLMLTYNGPQI